MHHYSVTALQRLVHACFIIDFLVHISQLCTGIYLHACSARTYVRSSHLLYDDYYIGQTELFDLLLAAPSVCKCAMHLIMI